MERGEPLCLGLLDLLEKTANCPRYRSDADFGLPYREFLERSLDHLQRVRSAAGFLQARTIILTAKGRREEALRLSILTMQLARQVDQESSLSGFLVAIAVRSVGVESANLVLRSGPVDDAARAALDAEIARHDLTESYRAALVAERAFGLSVFNDLNLGRFWLARGFWNNAVVPKSISPWNVLADLVVPALDAARQAADRCRANMRCLRVLNAVTRLEQRGVAVTGVGDLGLPEQETTDPFTG
jgi:hypothetical protein